MPFRFFLASLFALALGLLPAFPALPQTGQRAVAAQPAKTDGRRIALVIGNGDYQYPDNLPKLPNPTNDAQDIAEALRGFGFEVIERKNQTLEAMNQTIAEFGSRIGGSEAALFYFAGHGIQVKNQNYLMPVNAKIDSEAAVPYQGVDMNRILDEMDNARSAVNIVMLDACRNNPISGKFRSGKSRGLASPGSAPQGTVIVYATDPGNVAADGEGRNGLFSAGLLNAFKGGDLSLDGVLTTASEYVEQKSVESDPTRKQTPYVNGPKTVQKNFHFRVTVDPGRGEIEKTFWTSIERSTDATDFEAYLRKYPKGSYRALAENQLRRLKASQPAAPRPAAVAVPPGPTSAPMTSADPETQFWNEVKTSGARDYFDIYLKQYPKGKYVALAKFELKKLDDQDKAEQARQAAEKEQAAQRAEQAAWDAAKAGTSAAAYASYLDHYPSGRYAALARSAQQRLLREEDAQWKTALDTATRPAMQTYLAKYPSGRYVAQARQKEKDYQPVPPRPPVPAATLAMAPATYIAARPAEIPATSVSGYPNKPLRIIVPFAPGGASDIVARVLSQALAQHLGQAVIVENRPGAGGMIGVDAAAKSAPDGYTMLLGSSANISIGPQLYRNMPVNVATDLLPVAVLTNASLLLTVHPGVPVRSASEVIAYAKANPELLTYATSGVGSSSHLAAVAFETEAGIQMTHVPYKGMAPAIVDLLGGRVSLAFLDPASAASHVKTGKLRALAVTGDRRQIELPDLPTFAEQGMPRVHFTPWNGIFVPAGTPAAIVRHLNAEVRRAMQQPDLVDVLARGSVQAAPGGSSEDFAAFVRDDTARMARWIKAGNIRID
ncbi:MAG: tripartite tricarboxylate transporter substrate-binding protein [Sulfuritalea sp.]|nr:tripartite tricarboxylate transporter substrate-binding protein [Sulfuritalea sp.]